MGKVRLLRVPHLVSIFAARRSPLVGILSEGWPPHTVLGWIGPHQADLGTDSLLGGVI